MLTNDRSDFLEATNSADSALPGQMPESARLIEEGAASGPSVPIPESSPRLDEVCTCLRPVLTWTNSVGGISPLEYTVQLDTTPRFESEDLVEMNSIPGEVYTTSVKLEKPLRDNTRWFWRVKAVDSSGSESAWSTECGGITARFFVCTAMGEKLEHVRVPVREVTASSGYNKDGVLDYDDDNMTFWEGAANQTSHWVRFDLGEEKTVSRIFLTCGRAGWKTRSTEPVDWTSKSNFDGRLSCFVWQQSGDGEFWTDITETGRSNSDSFREIFDFNKPVTARYIRLLIKTWHGRSPRVYSVMLYAGGQPPVSEAPAGNYVLVISNNIGFTTEPGTIKTRFGNMARGLEGHVAPPWDLDVLEMPAHAFSVEALAKMSNKPLAIFLTGSPNNYCQIPLFEINGEFELIRTTDIPMWGACCGMQFMAMAYGSTYVRAAGRAYMTNETKDIIVNDIPPVYIQKNDPIFAGMNNPFYGPEFHTWMVQVVPEGWEVLATSRDTNGFICNEMIKATGRTAYGSQFHPEMAKPFSCSKALLMNFLAMAVDRAKKEGTWIG